VVIFGKLAGIAQKYLKKGVKVYVEGSLRTRRWTDKQGVERYSTEIVLSQFDGNIIMLDSRGGGDHQPLQAGYVDPTKANPVTANHQGFSSPIPNQNGLHQPPQQQAMQESPGFDDDIPF